MIYNEISADKKQTCDINTHITVDNNIIYILYVNKQTQKCFISDYA